jgi:hypothetical protein
LKNLLDIIFHLLDTIRAVDLLPKVSSKWLSSNRISSSSPPLLIPTFGKSKRRYLRFWKILVRGYLRF